LKFVQGRGLGGMRCNFRITNADTQAFRIAAFGSELKVANPKQQGNIYMKIKRFIFAIKQKSYTFAKIKLVIFSK